MLESGKNLPESRQGGPQGGRKAPSMSEPLTAAPRGLPAPAGAPLKIQHVSKRRALSREYRHAIVAAAREHRKLFGQLFLSDPNLKDRAARFYRSLLLPRSRRPGRPRSAQVTEAAKLRRDGLAWPQIYERVIPEYRRLNYDSQQRRAERLQHAVRAREKNSFRKSSRQKRPPLYLPMPAPVSSPS